MNEQIKELAKLMGRSERDVESFVLCLRLWMDKGYSFERAIEMHLAQMTRLVNKAVELAGNQEFRRAIAGEVWEAAHAQKVAA